MDHQAFYDKLFEPVEQALGPMDPHVLHALIGFDVGGPLCFHTIGANRKDRFITYVSCELAVRKEQRPASVGTYELLVTCDNEPWVRRTLTAIGALSMEQALDDLHTIDLGAVAQKGDVIQGVFLESFSSVRLGGKKHGVLRCVGITRDEMEFARKVGVKRLINRLKKAGVYPKTEVGRSSVLKG